MFGLRYGALFAAILLCPALAAAQDKPPLSPVTFRSHAAHDVVEHAGTDLRRTTVGIGVIYTWLPPLSLYADLRYGTTSYSHQSSIDDDLAANGHFRSQLDVSAAIGGSLRVLQRGPFWLDIGAEFETSVLNAAPDISSLDITTPQGTFAVAPYAQKHFDVSASWHRMAAGATVGARFGLFEPRIALAFRHTYATLDIKLNDESRETLSLLGHDSSVVENPHVLSAYHVVVMPAVDLHLGRHDSLGLGSTIAPESPPETYGLSLTFQHRF